MQKIVDTCKLFSFELVIDRWEWRWSLQWRWSNRAKPFIATTPYLQTTTQGYVFTSPFSKLTIGHRQLFYKIRYLWKCGWRKFPCSQFQLHYHSGNQFEFSEINKCLYFYSRRNLLPPDIYCSLLIIGCISWITFIYKFLPIEMHTNLMKILQIPTAWLQTTLR